MASFLTTFLPIPEFTINGITTLNSGNPYLISALIDVQNQLVWIKFSQPIADSLGTQIGSSIAIETSAVTGSYETLGDVETINNISIRKESNKANAIVSFSISVAVVAPIDMGQLQSVLISPNNADIEGIAIDSGCSLRYVECDIINRTSRITWEGTLFDSNGNALGDQDELELKLRSYNQIYNYSGGSVTVDSITLYKKHGISTSLVHFSADDSFLQSQSAIQIAP